MGPLRCPKVVELPGVTGNSFSHQVIWRPVSGQMCTDIVGQCDSSGLPKSVGRFEQRAVRLDQELVDLCPQTQNCNSGETFGGKIERTCRQIESSLRALRMDVASRAFQVPGSSVGATPHRQVRVVSDSSVADIQQSVLRSHVGRDRCVSSAELGTAEQFCEPPISVDFSGVGRSQGTKCHSDIDSPLLAGTGMVSGVTTDVNSSSIKATVFPKDSDQVGASGGATEEPKVEDIRLESIWGRHLKDLGWSHRARKQFLLKWSPSTLATYNRVLEDLCEFCMARRVVFPPRVSSLIADFLCNVADSSTRPRGVLSTASAALSCMYDGLAIENPMRESAVRGLIMALVKSGTSAPRKVTPIMPLQKFHDLFLSWPENNLLSMKQLRLKTLVLLAIVFMLRPSDIAPRSVYFDPVKQCTKRVIFSTDQVKFEEDGALTIRFHGIKNDYLREGFSVTVPRASCEKLDPVSTLQLYITRTDSVRPEPDRPVFLSLQRPFGALSSDSVARVLEEGIKLAGLSGFSAKSFRPTGASMAVAMGMDRDNARHIGRWRCREVFEDHYVHSRVPKSYADDLFNFDHV